MMKFTGCSLNGAIEMATRNHAKLYGLNEGSIAVNNSNYINNN